MEAATAREVVAFAVDQFQEGLVLAASFQDCVLIDIATRVKPDIEVLFIDTGSHFAETLDYVEQVRRLYRLRLRVLRSDGRQCPPCGQSGCCDRRKVQPLNQALEGKLAWMSGLRKADSPERADSSAMCWDTRRRMDKFNPLVNWSDQDVAGYVDQHGLPRHPLATAGYPSIGCAPTTQPVAPGAHPRSGRWPGTEKTECGIHI